jgi:hypothetical protein
VSDYEKAMLLLKAHELSYLHLIAWHVTVVCDVTDRHKIEGLAVTGAEIIRAALNPDPPR